MEVLAEGGRELGHGQSHFVGQEQEHVIEDSIRNCEGPARVNYTPETVCEVVWTDSFEIA